MKKSFTLDDALRLLAAEKVVTLVAHPPHRSLVTEIAGGPVRGSWWGHPAGGAIFAVASALEDHPDALVAKVVDGRVAFVHRDLWPPLIRVLTDAGRRRAATAALDDPARALLARVRRAGELSLDTATAVDKKARAALDRWLLVHSSQQHTPSGKHVPVLQTWERWATPETIAAAAALSYEEAQATLANAGIAPRPHKATPEVFRR